VEDDAVKEALAQMVSEPDEMPSGTAVGGGVRLYLEGEEILSAELGEDVDLVSAVLLAEVVQAGARLADCALGANLGGDEGVEQAADTGRSANARWQGRFGGRSPLRAAGSRRWLRPLS
jgi:hypothetical protein